MKPIKEKDLLNLGFKRQDVSFEESGDKPFYYFTFDIGKLCLISNSNDECLNDNYCIEIFDYDDVSFNDVVSLTKLIELLVLHKKLDNE